MWNSYSRSHLCLIVLLVIGSSLPSLNAGPAASVAEISIITAGFDISVDSDTSIYGGSQEESQLPDLRPRYGQFIFNPNGENVPMLLSNKVVVQRWNSTKVLRMPT